MLKWNSVGLSIMKLLTNILRRGGREKYFIKYQLADFSSMSGSFLTVTLLG